MLCVYINPSRFESRDDIEEVKLRCKNNNWIFGTTPLFEAINKGSADVVKMLLENGSKPNVQNYYGETSLGNILHGIFVTNEAILEITECLLENGADVNQPNGAGDTPLHIACKMKKSMEIIKLLVNSGANINYQLLPDRRAVLWSDISIDVYKFLIEAGADVNVVARKRIATPLMAAACYGCAKAVKVLIEFGADVNYISEYGETALDVAGLDLVGLDVDYLLRTERGSKEEVMKI